MTNEVQRKTYSIAFFGLFLPFGIAKGYAGVALSYHLSKAGLPTTEIGFIVSLVVWPQTLKAFWAPLIDTMLGPRIWYAWGAIGTGSAVFLLTIMPVSSNTIPILAVLVTASSITSTFVSMSSESLMAHAVPDSRKGMASGWAQAGNIGGAGIGGGLGLFLSQHSDGPWFAASTLAGACVACSICLLAVSPYEKRRPERGYAGRLRIVGHEVWQVLRSRNGALALFLMALPIGSGGALSIWPAIAREWQATGGTVALVNGMLGGIFAIAGAGLSGFLYDRFNRQSVYCGLGLIIGFCAVLMASLPREPIYFTTFALLYAALTGACFAGYSSIVLEVIGRGAVATKFNIFASVANIPIALMTMVDGRIHDRFGTVGMLVGEAIAPILAVAFFLSLKSVTGGHPSGSARVSD